MLDLDLTLDALACDHPNTNHLYAVKINPTMAEWINVSAKINGHSLVTSENMFPAKVNGTHFLPSTTKSKLSEEMVREMFAPFGTVEGVLLPAKLGHARHAHIRELTVLLFGIILNVRHANFLHVPAQSLRVPRTNVQLSAPQRNSGNKTTLSVKPSLRLTYLRGLP